MAARPQSHQAKRKGLVNERLSTSYATTKAQKDCTQNCTPSLWDFVRFGTKS